jgi:CBS domain-containing protein
MNPDVLTLSPKETVREAARLLAEHNFGGAPVVDDSGTIVGIVTQNDLARFAARQATVGETGQFFTDQDDYADLGRTRSDTLQTPIEQVMSTSVFTVNPDDGVAIAANLMRERRVHRLVVTREGRLAGMITTLDLMRVVEERV